MLSSRVLMFKRYKNSPYVILLSFIFLMTVIFPALGDSLLLKFIFKLMMIAILLSAMYILEHNKRSLIISSCLVTISISLNILLIFFSHKWLLCLDLLAAILFLSYIILIHLRQLLFTINITTNLLYAALCNYILIIMLIGFVYALMAVFNPHAFMVIDSHAYPSVDGELKNVSIFVYYSTITMTGVGFGDIVPVSHLARSISMLEALVGQFYIVVLVARLVSLYVMTKTRHYQD